MEQIRVRRGATGVQRGAEHGGGVGVRFERGEHDFAHDRWASG
jgi:hypothetical protein